MKILNRLAIYKSCIKRMMADMKQLSYGQKTGFDLLQLSHRLEKGLLIKNPKPLWGWEKAYKMDSLLKINRDEFAATTAKSVLSAYLDSKSKSSYQEDRDSYTAFIQKTGYQLVPFENIGGTIEVKKNDFSSDEFVVIEKMFNTRHSCREFSSQHVKEEDIAHAVNMALRCPSACNRQPFKVYVIDPSKLEQQLGGSLQYQGDRTVVITGDVRAFNANELLDWLISPSIFAGYLTLAFHSLGIGCCVIRKDLVKPSDYNEAVRAVTGMDESERIVLELFIGYYNDDYSAPVSNRKDASDVIKFV